MGELGKSWPKPLWNLFETNLLGLQLKYIDSLGVKNIAVNTHHQHEHVIAYLEDNYPNIRVSFEDVLLGSGGGVHKVLNDGLIDKSKPFGVFNSDSYLFESKASWDELLKMGYESGANAALFMSSISREDSYNAVIYDETGKMQSIENQKDNIVSPHTYSGFGIIFPEMLQESTGVSSFFSSVADYKSGKVLCVESRESLIDFGTVDIYKSLINEISEKKGQIFERLCSYGLLDVSKLEAHSYGSSENVFNFTGVKNTSSGIKFTIGKGSRLVAEDEEIALYLD